MRVNYIAISYSRLKQVTSHKHDSWEIILNIKGSGLNYIGDNTTEFHPDTISICPPDTFHCKTTKEEFFQDIYVRFDDPYLFNNLKKYCFKDDSDQKIRKLMLMVNNIYHKKEKGYQIIADLLVESICSILVSWDNSSPSDERVSLLKNKITQNFTNPGFKVEQAMDKINYCNDYVRRCFKKDTGLTPTEYLNRLKIDYAKKLLQKNTYPEYPISDVAYMSGFYDVGYFSRIFKKLEGISPSHFIHRQPFHDALGIKHGQAFSK